MLEYALEDHRNMFSVNRKEVSPKKKTLKKSMKTNKRLVGSEIKFDQWHTVKKLPGASFLRTVQLNPSILSKHKKVTFDPWMTADFSKEVQQENPLN